jgi:hypothetical protein
MRTILINGEGPRIGTAIPPVALGPGAAADDDPRTAEVILRPGLDLWAWRRSLSPGLAAAAAALAAGPPGSARVAVAHPAGAADLEPALVALGAPPGPARTRLAADGAGLCALLARVVGTPRVAVRLEVARCASCPLFHVDTITVRLICTYVGPGTEWLAAGDADRGELGLRRRSLAAANAAIAGDRAQVRRLPAGWVALVKGALAAPGGGLVHRSPGEETPRLVLIADPLPEEAA